MYTVTRHNIGFMMVDIMVDRLGGNFSKNKNALIAKTAWLGQTVYWLKPQTYMNHSVKGVSPIMQWLKVNPSQLVIIHDDIDLNFGVIRHKFGGGAGGHNGLKSLDQGIGNQYWRLRLGVGRPPLPSMVSDYVLSAFDENAMNILPNLLNEATEHLEAIVLKI